MTSNLRIIEHPLIKDKLTKMRDINCPMREFKGNLFDIAVLMTPYITEDLELSNKEIQTPLTDMTAEVLSSKTPVIVPILRAALGMSAGIESILKDSPVGHIGVYRNEETKLPVEYLVKLPPVKGKKIILVDPMLATGHSAAYAVSLLIKAGAKSSDILFVGLIAAPEGVKYLGSEYPDIKVNVAALDDRLDDNAYITPGLGDAGDRIFGTHDK